jgi:hypothetical protein
LKKLAQASPEILEAPLSKFNMFGIPVALVVPMFVKTYWSAVITATMIGGIISVVLALRFILEYRKRAKDNPAQELQMQTESMQPMFQLKFIANHAAAGFGLQFVWALLFVWVIQNFT